MNQTRIGSTDISNVHLCSFRTGEQHSQAKRPDWTIQLPFHMNRADSGIVLQTMDELLAIAYISNDKTVSEILVWNWKLGILVHRIHSLASSSTFGFFTPNSLLVFDASSTDTPIVKLSIFEISRVPPDPAPGDQCVYVVSSYAQLAACAELAFPTFPAGSTVDLLLSAEPSPAVTSFRSSKFVPAPKAGVPQLCLTLLSRAEHGQRLSKYQIFLGKEYLLKYLPSLNKLSEPADHPITIPWEDWGERASRWFSRASTTDPYLWNVYGTRSIQGIPIGENSEDRSFEYLSVLEFHPPTVRRFSSLSIDRHLSMWGPKTPRRHIDFQSSERELRYVFNALQNKQSASKENLVFVDTIDEDVPAVTFLDGQRIISRLPYRIVTRIRPVIKRRGWVMDNEHIVGMPVCIFYRTSLPASTLFFDW